MIVVIIIVVVVIEVVIVILPTDGMPTAPATDDDLILMRQIFHK